MAEDFKCSIVDPCVYTRFKNYLKVIIVVFVDDIVIASNYRNQIDLVKQSLCNRIKTKDLGKFNWFLGIKFDIQPECITM